MRFLGYTNSYRDFTVVFNRFIILLLMVAMLSTLFVAPVRALSLRGFMNLADNFINELNCIANPLCGAIDELGEETRATIITASEEIQELIDLIDEVYKDNLDFTIDKLDTFTRNKIFEVEDLIKSLNSELQDTVKLISGELDGLIKTFNQELRTTINEMEESIKDVVAFTIAGVVYLIDRATLNIIVIVSLILLGVGLIVFATLLFRARKEQSRLRLVGMGLMVIHILFFGALVLSPDFRAQIIVSTQLGLRQAIEQDANIPEIQVLQPNPLNLADHDRLEVWGAYLLENGEAPEVRIDGQTLPLIEADNSILILDTTGLQFGNNVTSSVDLTYDDSSLDLRQVIVINEFNAPPPQFPVSLSLKIVNARFPSSLRNFFATPRITLFAGEESDSESTFLSSETDVKYDTLKVTTRAMRDELIPIKVTLRSGAVMNVDEFELDWTQMQNCDGGNTGTCTITHDTRTPFQGEQVTFTITYCMSTSAGSSPLTTTTLGDPCDGPPVVSG